MPQFDVISNVDAAAVPRRRRRFEDNLVALDHDEVRWHDTAERLLSYDLDLVVEFGASGVLGPLMKRMPNAPQRVLVVSDYVGSSQKLRRHRSQRHVRCRA